MIKIGIIGCGAIVKQRHAPECFQNPNVEIVGFCNRSRERAEEMVKCYGGKVYAGVEEMLKDAAIDTVLVATSNDSHADISVKALVAGKNVLCEKPCAINREEVEKIKKEVEKSDAMFMVAQNQRFDAVHIKAKELLKRGVIGKFLYFTTEFSHGGPEGWSVQGTNTWFLKNDKSVLGALGDLGIHKIDLLRWLCDKEICSVKADLRNIHKRNCNGEYLQMNDYAVCQVEMEEGIVGTIFTSWCNYGKCRNQTVLYGTEGTLTINSEAEQNQICLWRGERKKEWSVAKQNSSGIIAAFVDAILAKRQSPVGILEAERDMNVVFSCMESKDWE